jgi:hypothetical protein
VVKEKIKAVAYLRTSSAANVGSDKDSEHRQRQAIAAFAQREDLEVVEEFYDADVSGTDPIETRPGFSALLERIEGNGVRTVVVEDASRFARQLIIQEAGIIALIARGVRVLTASGDPGNRTGGGAICPTRCPTRSTLHASLWKPLFCWILRLSEPFDGESLSLRQLPLTTC